jgi:LDH2 family malate/lactate/ureidoglycolate dehydrogenase
VKGLQEGYIVPGVEFDIREPVPAIAAIDAKNGVGQVVSELAMDLAVAKARANGIGVVTVGNSNHFGIAGYYVQKAIDAGMLGVSLTNAAPLVVPTNGADAVLGTNPIAVGAPGENGLDFLLDMATSVVPRGKLEVYDRNRKQMPNGWAVNANGYDTHDPGLVLHNLLGRVGGGILPLGGRGEQFSGYKGYGLALMVDVLTGVLSGAAYGPDVDNVHRQTAAGEKPAPRVGHFFQALDVSRFMPLEEFRRRMADLLHAGRRNPLRAGATLFDLADELAQVVPDTCRRTGRCRECVVEVRSGGGELSPPTEAEAYLRPPYRLACQARVDGTDADIEVAVLRRRLQIVSAPEGTAALPHPVPLDPAVRREGDDVLRDGLVLDRYRGALLGLAIDVGTTTVVMELVDLESGAGVRRIAIENPQRFGGSDVISRIEYEGAQAPGELRRALRRALDHELRAACGELGVERHSIVDVVLVGPKLNGLPMREL